MKHQTLLLASLLFPLSASAADPAPSPAPVPPGASAASEAKPAEAKATDAKPAEPKPEPPSVKIDLGSVKLNTLLQMWYIDDSTSTGAKNNFRARRAELNLSGNLNPDARWFLMVDPAKSLKAGPVVATNDNKVLQDLGLAYSLGAGFELQAGQFKIPTTAESLDSSGDLPFLERSMVARQYGDKRTQGLQGQYKDAKWKATAMYSNGGNANTDDSTTAKDFHVRLDFTPITGFSFGGWAGANEFSFSDNGKWGLNARWKGDAEFARFELAKADDTVAGTKTKSDGYVAEVGYLVLPQLQPAFRFERYFPNSLGNDSAKASTLGLNYFLMKNNAKLQLNYAWTEHVKGSNGSYAPDLGIGNGKILTLGFQMAL